MLRNRPRKRASLTPAAAATVEGAASEPAVESRRKLPYAVAAAVGKYGALIALAILLATFTIASPQYFLTTANLLQILNQSALTAIIACALTIVLVAGNFDVSIGYLASLSGILCTHLMISGVPVPVAILLTVVGGVVAGLVNGILVTRLEINALVATLGSGSVLLGINYLISGGAPQDVSTLAPNFLKLTIGPLFGVPRLVYYMIAVAAILWVLLNKTGFGRYIQAIGGNTEAARLVGIPVATTVTWTFVISGVGAAVTGVLLASSIGSGQATAGDGYVLPAFAAAFLGSTVMREGQFHIVGTIVGVVVVSAGFNGLALVGVPSFAEFLFQGVLLIMAVAFSSLGRRLSRE